MRQQPCIPDILPIPDLNWESLAPFISKATMALARYDGTLDGILNSAVLLSPITEQEAILSSRIEGTIASLVEVLGQEAGEEFDEHKRGSIHEIVNYRKALFTAEDYLKDRPITLQLIRELHGMLMKDVRGGDKTPGQFRTDQNHIGKKGTTIDQARFIPPSPVVMQSALDNFQAFMESNYSDPLVQLAVIHGQFEIIHPFNDGNGRIGRMLIPMFLYRKGVLQRPMFYLSEYLEEHDTEYRDRLLAITNDKDWHGWIEFFLRAIHIQADKNNQKARNIHDLYERMKQDFSRVTRSQFSQAALDAFFRRPICNTPDFQTISGITSKATAGSILRSLQEHGLIVQVSEGTGRRPSRYALPELINIAEGKQVFVIKEKI
jgi:Fic family protein